MKTISDLVCDIDEILDELREVCAKPGLKNHPKRLTRGEIEDIRHKVKSLKWPTVQLEWYKDNLKSLLSQLQA